MFSNIFDELSVITPDNTQRFLFILTVRRQRIFHSLYAQFLIAHREGDFNARTGRWLLETDREPAFNTANFAVDREDVCNAE